MNCFRFFTVFFLLFPLFAVAQPDKSNYALLWEITGNGLEHPSYLFGTMHVQDRRAFEFPDSLRIAFESAEAYAMEVNPNAAVSYFMELSFGGDTSNVLRQLLSEEEYRRVDALVQKQLGQPIDSMDVKDPMLLKMLLSDFEEPEETEGCINPQNSLFLNPDGIIGIPIKSFNNSIHQSFLYQRR